MEFSNIFEFFKLNAFTIFYIIPLIGSAVWHTFELTKEIKQDIHYRDRLGTHYNPGVTVGTILGYILTTVTPIVNVIVFCFFTIPWFFGDLFDFLRKVFNTPIVAKKPQSQKDNNDA